LKPRLAAVAEIKRLKRKVSQLETIRKNDEGAARMVQLFEKKYSDERNRNSILRYVPAFLSVFGTCLVLVWLLVSVTCLVTCLGTCLVLVW
jgi:hypothetical protein